MPTYIDTSALLRAVEQRGDRTKVDAAFRDDPISASLTELECWTSLHKKFLDGEIDATRRDAQLRTATALLGGIALVGLDEDVMAEAFNLTRLHPLRTLDGLHLAAASVSRRALIQRGYALRFCTADRRQAQAAEQHFGADQVDLVPPWR